MSKPEIPELAGFRQKIDAIDDQILTLLGERCGHVRQVGALKAEAAPGQCAIRAGREADMVRRVVAKCQAENLFPPAAAGALWRNLIGASTSLETPLSISALTEGNDDLYWLAREYFGPFVPVVKQPNVKRVIGDVMDGTASIGMIPIIRSDDTSYWWKNLMQPGDNSPKIFAQVPFVQTPISKAAGFAIAKIAPEPSSGDLSLFVLELEHNVSQHRLQQAFAKVGLGARWINVAMFNDITRHHLIEISGFVTLETESFKNFAAEIGKSMVSITNLGAYAVPVKL